MSTVKINLKNAREAIASKSFDDALKWTERVLDVEPNNYMGLVLSGLAYQNLGQPDKGEVAYKKAIAASPDQPLAREGLVNFYEKLQRWGSLMTALEDNLQFYLKAADEKKALSVTEQLIALYTKEGVMDKAIEKMQSLLPGSELYDLLSSDHRPDQMETLKRLAGVQETTDAQFYEREVRARRGRLGGGTLEQVQAAVRKEVYSKSQLGATYESIMEIDPENHKDLELKLLEFYVKKMESIAQDQKPAVRDKALALSSKMIQESSSPDLSPLPHELLLKFHDAHSSSDYDTALQHQYIATFPQTALSKMIQAQMHYVNGDGGEEPSSREELSGLLDEAFKMDSTIVYGYLVLCWMDYDSQDFEAGLEHSTAGRDLLNKQSVATAFEYPKMRRSFELCMANCQFKISPKLAPNALELYRHILQEDENNIDALQGVGFVLSSEERYEEATESFERVLALDSSHISARSEVGWICYLQKDYEQAEERLREVVETSENPRALDLYRLGRVYYDMGGEYKENSAYSHAQLIAAARLDPHCAGAFTYLGHYYREVVQDDARAEKCYQHAFTLDPRESAAGEHLSDYLLTSGSLEGAMDVYERVIEASKDHRSNNWALLRLGFAELIRGNNLEAMSAFQKLLRNDVKNPLAWEGVAEAYQHEGRYMAALKAFTRTKELLPDSTVAVYHIARVHQRLGMYPEAIEHYEAALAQAEKNQEPRHVPSLMGITESFLEQGKEYFVTGCYGRSAEFLGHALEYGHQLLALDSQILSAWKLVGDACLAYRAVPRYLHLCPFKTLRAIMEILPEDTNQLLHFPAKMDEEPLRVLGQIQTMDASEFFEASTEKSCQALESIFTVAGMAYKQANVLNGNEGHPAAQFWYDIALSYYYRHENAIRRNGDGAVSKTSPWLGVTMRCLKASLQFEDDNPVVWNALGVASMTTNAKISQHALIKSIEYDPKNPAPWSNLGYLYILHSELDLALKAFTTAQTLDPSFGQAWTGQACVASLWGSPEATALFAHACESSTASILEANYGYAVNTFRDLVQLCSDEPTSTLTKRGGGGGAAGSSVAGGSAAATTLLVTPAFALSKYLEQRPRDVAGWNLLGLIRERFFQYQGAADCFRRAIEIQEEEEIQEVAGGYQRRQAMLYHNYARALVSMQDFGQAVGAYERSLELEGPEASPSRVRTCKHLGAGLALYYAGELEKSLQMFETALAETEQVTGMEASRDDVVVLLSQVLWALGGEEQRSVAKEELFRCIAQSPTHLRAIFGLGAMGLVQNDETLATAALKEVLKFSRAELQALDPERQADEMVAQYYQLLSEHRLAMSTLAKAVHERPSEAQAWQRLSEHLSQTATTWGAGGGTTFSVAASNARAAVDRMQSQETVEATLLSNAYAQLTGTTLLADAERMQKVAAWKNVKKEKIEEEERQSLGRVRTATTIAQRAVMAAPWNPKAWQVVGAAMQELVQKTDP